MTGAEKIVEKILADARAEAEEIRSQARQEAEQTAEKAAREAEQEQERILKDGRRQAEERRRHLVTSAQMEGRRQVLAAKEELIDEVLETARQELTQMPDDEYARVLEGLLLEAAPGGESELILSSRDKERLGEDFLARVNGKLQERGGEARINLAADTRPLDGGFVLRQGGVELNYSFSALLKARREDLESEVAELLFGEAEAGGAL